MMIILPLLFAFESKCDNEIRDFAQKTVDKILDVVADDSMSSDKKSALLEKTFMEVVDVPWIAKYTLGRHWTALTPSQTADFIRLYELYLVNI